MARKQIHILSLGLVVCGVLSATGCGRTGQRTALLPRVNVADIMDGGGTEETQDLPSEQYVNNQIDEQLRKSKSDIQQASNTVLASAENGVDRLKKMLPGSRSTAEPIGRDPFLDSIDEIIAKDAEAVTQSARETIADSVDQAFDQLNGSEAAEMFADLPEQAQQRTNDLVAATEDAVDKASASASDVFGAAAEDVFGGSEAVVDQATNVVQNGLEQISAAGQDRRSLAQRTGATVHRFDELFDEAEGAVQQPALRQPAVQQVVNETRDAIARTAESARFEASDFANEVVDAGKNAIAEVEAAVEDQFDATADMFEPPAPEITIPAELPTMPEEELPTPPEIPGLRVAAVDQKDAVVTPNAPATLPDLANDFAVEMPDDVGETAMDRIAVQADDPIFSEPQLPSVDEIPEVAIPDPGDEPAPRFTEVATNGRGQLTTRPPVSASAVPVQKVSVTKPVAASVLPDVDWQGREATPSRTFRAPSEWTAWFLMGGAALIILLLFAPSRRDS